MDNDQIERAQWFAQKKILNGKNITDEWSDFEGLDLHFDFTERHGSEWEKENGVFAYPVNEQADGYRDTDTSTGVKILDWKLNAIREEF